MLSLSPFSPNYMGYPKDDVREQQTRKNGPHGGPEANVLDMVLRAEQVGHDSPKKDEQESERGKRSAEHRQGRPRTGPANDEDTKQRHREMKVREELPRIICPVRLDRHVCHRFVRNERCEKPYSQEASQTHPHAPPVFRVELYQVKPLPDAYGLFLCRCVHLALSEVQPRRK